MINWKGFWSFFTTGIPSEVLYPLLLLALLVIVVGLLGWTIGGYSEYDVSASLVRLGKFGVLDLMYDRSVSKADYSHLKDTPFLEGILAAHKLQRPGIGLSIKGTKSVLFVNEYGRQFYSACR